MKRGRPQARARWQDVADAKFNPDTLLWLANMATAVLRADDSKGTDAERRAAVIDAVGLFGLYNEQREKIRAVVRAVDHQLLRDEHGDYFDITGAQSRKLQRGERSARVRDAVAEALELIESPAAIDKRIARALAN